MRSWRIDVCMTSDDLPLILAGPIVRRVDATMISVWIALSRAAAVALNVYSGWPIHAGAEPAPHASGSASTVPIGEHLHIALVVIDLVAGQELQQGSTYSYQLSIDGADLKALGLLRDDEPARLALG